jgi:uncharacterized metal-binding protein/predicted Fe-Mo cluster-binding NifX family protein
MRWGVPLLGDRVAPRCTSADSLLIVGLSRGRVASQVRVPITIRSPLELAGALAGHGIDSLACGGISTDTREALLAQAISVIENVACSAEEVVAALDSGSLCPGYGFSGHTPATGHRSGAPAAGGREAWRGIDCLACENRVCLAGADCRVGGAACVSAGTGDHSAWLEAAADIAGEEERKLCRLAEVVYFALEMRFQRVGLAFCVDLLEPCRILGEVLARFFEVVPVCCRIGGAARGEPGLPCNPLAQAVVLNDAATDLNVVAGLCIGADCVFNQASAAPVTTLFVKDRSLAHNPIGAVYSEYYLRESASAAPERLRRVRPGVPEAPRGLAVKER